MDSNKTFEKVRQGSDDGISFTFPRTMTERHHFFHAVLITNYDKLPAKGNYKKIYVKSHKVDFLNIGGRMHKLFNSPVPFRPANTMRIYVEV